MQNAGAINAKVRSIQEKIVNVLVEFIGVGILQIPKDRLCKLTGYTSTFTKTWATAFKLTKNQGSIQVSKSKSNGEVVVELMGYLPYPMREPERVEALLRKYSKELKIQQTVYDVFDVLLGRGRGCYIRKGDLANDVNKNIATKSFTDSLKLLKSFGVLEVHSSGRGVNSSYRLVQSLIRSSDAITDARVAPETETLENNPTVSTCRETEAPASFQPEELPYAVGNGMIPQCGEDLLYHHQEERHQTAETFLEANAYSVLQVAGEVATDEAETSDSENIFMI